MLVADPAMSADPLQPVASVGDMILRPNKDNKLKREFGLVTLVGFTFTVVSLAPSLSALLVDAFPGSGVGLTWGWFTPSVITLSIFITLSELLSAMPSAAGPYWWTYELAPVKWRNFLSFFCGYAATLGLLAGIGSCNYGAAEQILACVQMRTGYAGSNPVLYGIFAGLSLIELALVCLPRIVVTILDVATAIMNMAVIFIVCIALPVGLRSKGVDLNSGDFVFGDTKNYTNYPYGFTFMMSWGTNIWTLTGVLTPIYLIEEAKRPRKDLPLTMLGTYGLCAILGFVMLSVIAACMDGSREGMEALIGNNLPLAAIIERALNKNWAAAIMSVFAFLQFSMAFSALTANSRQMYAFARDDALPFSRWLKLTMTKDHLPIPALIFATVIPLLIGLLIFAGPVAANAIFSLNCASAYLSLFIPVALYLFGGKNLETPGWFYTGRRWSKPIAAVTFAFMSWIIFVDNMFPANIPVKDPSNMNYTCLVCGAVWLGASLYWLLSARKWYNGPQSAINDLSIDIVDAKAPRDLDASSITEKYTEAYSTRSAPFPDSSSPSSVKAQI